MAARGVRYVFDRNIAPRISRAVALLYMEDGDDLLLLDDRFPKTCKDADWLGAIAADGIATVIVSVDGSIRRSQAERAALRSANLPTILLVKGWGQLFFPEFAWKLIRYWPSIAQKVSRDRVPMCHDVAMNGTITNSVETRVA